MQQHDLEPGPCGTPLTVEGTQVVVPQVHQVLQRGVELLQNTLWPGRSTLTPVFPMPQRPQQVNALPLRSGWVQQGPRELPQPRHGTAMAMYSRAQSAPCIRGSWDLQLPSLLQPARRGAMPEGKVAPWRAKWLPEDGFLPSPHTHCRQGINCKGI